MINEKKKRALRDLIFISAIALVVLVIGIRFEVAETFMLWARNYESLELDAIVLVPIVFGIAFGVYSWRRWRDLNEEITRREELEERLTRQALHDPLTGLPNRTLFMELLDNALARADRGGDPVTILFFDLDDFKVVNDSFGHGAGDQLLVATAHRIRSCLRPGDVVARLGGDEFTILLETPTSSDEAARVASRIVESFAVPFDLSGREARVTASLGVVIGVRENSEWLLRNADVAMYQAKRAGKARYEVFAGE